MQVWVCSQERKVRAACGMTRPRTASRVAVVAQHRRARGVRRRLSPIAAPGLRVSFVSDIEDSQRTCLSTGQQVLVGEADAAAAAHVACSDARADNCTHTCTDMDVLTLAKRAALDRLLAAVSEWLFDAFRMKTGPVGEVLAIDVSRSCGFGGEVAYPQRIVQHGGERAADTLILVTARPVAGSTVAFAGACQEDEGRSPSDSGWDTAAGDVPRYVPRRPTVGHMNLAPASLGISLDDAGEVDRLIKILLHEVFHVLGFNRDKLAQLPCPSAPAFDRLPGMRPCSLAGSIEPLIVRGGRAHLTTPRLLATARRHYNCSGDVSPPATATATASGGAPRNTPQACGGGAAQQREGQDAPPASASTACMDAMPLEDCRSGGDCSEGSGTAASHWERRIAYGEVMVGVAGGGHSAISDLTLAVFEDAGWFRTNLSVHAPRCYFNPLWCPASGRRDAFLWGRGRGCAFVTQPCDGEAWRAPGYWCAAAPDAGLAAQEEEFGREACTVGRAAVGRCTLHEHAAAVPPASRYFAASDRLGGATMEDYCPIVEPFHNWDCRVASPHASVGLAAMQSGEARCEACRCFESTLYNDSSRTVTHPFHGCYPHRCLSPSQLQISIDGRWYDCDEGGSPHTVAVEGWTGGVVCPAASELCADADDLGWPDVTNLSPHRGPADGGTAVTLSGMRLYGSDDSDAASGDTSSGEGAESAESGLLPRILLCGVEATGVRIVPGASGTAEPIQTIAALTAALPAATRESSTSIDISCHLQLIAPDARREAIELNAFTYVQTPRACRVLRSTAQWEWSTEQLTSLFICLWPHVLALTSALYVLRCGLRVKRGVAELRALKRTLRTRDPVLREYELNEQRR
jgi:hypothetical protein